MKDLAFIIALEITRRMWDRKDEMMIYFEIRRKTLD